MEYANLSDLIESLEYGTNLHIGVVFLKNYGNEKCNLSHQHRIHSRNLCEVFKSNAKGYRRCFRCRNMALRKAIKSREAFGGLCINGIYEYTRPVVMNGDVVCVIFIGNIITDASMERLKTKNGLEDIIENDTQRNFDVKRCETIGLVMENFITVLLEKYTDNSDYEKQLIKNIKAYISEHIEYEISIDAMAKFFNYNAIYFGRLFKKETGVTIKEYVNRERILLAEKLIGGSETIIELSQKVGFNNVTYFNKIFKEYTGLTPMEYRHTAPFK